MPAAAWKVRRNGFPSALREAWKRPQKTPQPFELQGFESGTPEGTRTPNLLIRSQTIYPIDLRVPCVLARGDRKPTLPDSVKNFGSDYFRWKIVNEKNGTNEI